MGERHVSAGRGALTAGVVAALALARLCAQGPAYREHWGYLHLENRRAELVAEVRARDEATRHHIAGILAAPDTGNPFMPVAKALADLRGVPCDDLFVLRTAVSAFVLPEVADPDATNEVCRTTNVSLYLPASMPLPAKLSFDVDVMDESGERLWTQRLEPEAEHLLADLRMAQLVAAIPSGDLADGTYVVCLRTLVDGVPPTAADPVLRWPFHVLRGYQARCEAAFASVREVSPALDGESRPLLQGIAAEVVRAYQGGAFEGASDAVNDLLRLEQALRNAAADAHVLRGISGDVPIQVAAGDGTLPCVVRLATERTGERPARPLVVFAAGAPSYDGSSRRPTAPATRRPRWLALEMRGFGARLDCDVAFVDSPGEARDYGARLGAAITSLRGLLGTDSKPVLLVCDREAAAVVALQAARLRDQVSGLVLVGSGGMTGETLDALGARPVRFVVLRGHAGAEGLRRSIDYAAARQREGAWDGDVALLVDAEMPWPFALPLLSASLESFAEKVFAMRPRQG